MKATKPRYKFSQCAYEDHKQAIFCVSFNRHVPYHMFATVGSNRVTVYKIENNFMEPILCFADPNPNESFYCCAWTADIFKSETILLAAGAHGIIRVISPSNPHSLRYLSGHGGAINDMKVNPVMHDIVLTCSKDHSIRLWNVKTEVCIAIFGGVEGHRDEVLSADFHFSGSKIVSCGMDHSLKIWNFDSDLCSVITSSFNYNDTTAKKSFPTSRKHFPTFSTRDIHRNYVDCVAFYGNFILSKSCENQIVCWRPGQVPSLDLTLPTKYTSDTSCIIMDNYEVKDCDIWFLRFSVDTKMKYLAQGNRVGRTHIFDLDSHDHDSKPIDRYVLSHPNCQSTIRQTCFSNDARFLVCTCDDGSIWMWEQNGT